MENLQKKIIAIRRHIHSYPELGGEEFATSRYIKSVLATLNIPARIVAKTGVIGILQSDKKSPCIAFRADIDALPVTENTKKSYSSKRAGVMHACGHDANTAIVLGAAMILSELKPDLTVKFIFQPNEENAGGADAIIRSGALTKPKVDAIFGVHVNPQLPPGTIGIRRAEMMAAVDRIKIELSGGGGHAAAPHTGRDTVIAASKLIMNLQTIVSRKIDPTEPAVISICKISGGTRFNVLAEKVELEGTVRTLNERTRKNIKLLITEELKNIANTSKLKFKLRYESLGEPLINDEKMLSFAVESAEKVVGKEGAIYISKPSMGGEDFAQYLKRVPGCFIYVGSMLKNNPKPWHHPEFDINEKALITGAKVLAQIAVDYAGKWDAF
ncbi:MAG: M20 family metallopeptidase [Elusimicrobiota bacterium]